MRSRVLGGLVLASVAVAGGASAAPSQQREPKIWTLQALKVEYAQPATPPWTESLPVDSRGASKSGSYAMEAVGGTATMVASVNFGSKPAPWLAS